MATVPTYDNFQIMPSANTGSRFNPPPTPPDAGALAKETGRSMNEASRLFAYAQAEQNKTMVDDATNQLVQEANRLQFDPKIGALSLQGKNALERPNNQSLNAEYGEKFKAFADKLTGADANPLRREAIQRRALQIASQLDTKLTAHVMRENKVYKDETYKASIANETQAAGLNFGDNAALTESYARADYAVERLAEMHGWSDDAKKANRAALLTPFHTTVVSARIDAGQSAAAQKYYDAIKDDLTPAAQDALRDAIGIAAVTTESMRFFDKYRHLGEGAVKRKAREEFDAGRMTAEVRDAVDRRAEHATSVARAHQAEADKRQLGQAYEFVRNNPGSTFDDMPVGLKQYVINRGMNHTVDSWFKSGGYPKTSNSQKWAEIMTNPAQLAGMSPLDIQKKWGGDFTETDLRTLYSYTQEGSKEKGAGEVLTTSEDVNAAGVRMGYLDPNKKKNTKEMADNFYKFQVEVQRQIDDYRLNNKKSPTRDEVRKIISNIEMDKVKRGIFERETPTFALTQDNLRDAYVTVGGENVNVATIPPGVRAVYGTRLRQMGVYPSNQQIANMWVSAGKPRELKRRE